jgi:hypothetical protein
MEDPSICPVSSRISDPIDMVTADNECCGCSQA